MNPSNAPPFAEEEPPPATSADLLSQRPQLVRLLSARIEYGLNANWSVALNAENLTDERYYRTMGTSTSSNWYGDPANYALTLRARW